MIGQTMSHYKILEKLGEGGMGVVYKAQDLTLNRLVALKFLPNHLSANDAEKARFLQEAQAAATLNHPNVCIIYEIKEENHQQFIVMEYVDGVTLREKISVGAQHVEPLRTNDAISYAVQIGEALQEAHSKGIVHRDIKADNIMVNSKNQIKVMDFGLAKLKGSLKLTKTSSTVGTLAYMAPEQIQGGEVDARSDLFSFGVVLYEMLTGRTPFRGEHEASMVYSIVNEDPEPIEKHRSDLSPVLVNLIQRVLEKDPNERYQSAGEMVIELRRLQKQSSKVSRKSFSGIPAPSADDLQKQPVPQGVSGFQEVIPSSRSSKTRFLWLGIAIAVVGVVTIAYLFFFSHPQRPLNPNMTFRILQIPFTQIGYPGLSKDADWAAFPAIDAKGKWDLYFMNSTAGEPRRITSDSSVFLQNVDISPDGSQIAYDRFTANGKSEILIVSSLGGSSKRIVDLGAFPRWRPDGQSIGFIRWKSFGSQSGKVEFWTVNPDGSNNHREFIDSLTNVTSPSLFSWSPDGKFIGWIREFPQRYQEVMVFELGTGRSRQVTFDKKNINDVCWTRHNEILYASNKSGNTNLWMIPASGGNATQITKGSGPDMSMKISFDGNKLLYLQQQSSGHIWIANIDGTNPRQITFDESNPQDVFFSPNGKQLIYCVNQLDPLKSGRFIYSIDRDGSNRRQLTSGDEWTHNPIYSPDGKWIIYGAHAATEAHDSCKVYLISAGNPGSPKLVGKGVPFWWLDGKSFVTFTSIGSWIGTIEGTPTQKFYLDSTFAIPVQKGKYIYYYDSRQNHEGLWITTAPEVKNAQLFVPKKLLGPGFPSNLDPGEKSIYYVKNVSELRRISLPDGKEERIRGAFPGLSLQSNLAISYDGKEIVYLDTRINGKLVMIDNLH